MPSPDPEWLWDLIDIFAKRVELTEPRISRLSESGKVLSVFSGFARVEELGECLLVRHLLSPVSFPLMTEGRRRCALAFCELRLLPSFLCFLVVFPFVFPGRARGHWIVSCLYVIVRGI